MHNWGCRSPLGPPFGPAQILAVRVEGVKPDQITFGMVSYKFDFTNVPSICGTMFCQNAQVRLQRQPASPFGALYQVCKRYQVEPPPKNPPAPEDHLREKFHHNPSSSLFFHREQTHIQTYIALYIIEDRSKIEDLPGLPGIAWDDSNEALKRVLKWQISSRSVQRFGFL